MNVVKGANDGHYSGICVVCKKRHAKYEMHYLGQRKVTKDHVGVCSNKCGLVLFDWNWVACGCGG